LSDFTLPFPASAWQTEQWKRLWLGSRTLDARVMQDWTRGVGFIYKNSIAQSQVTRLVLVSGKYADRLGHRGCHTGKIGLLTTGESCGYQFVIDATTPLSCDWRSCSNTLPGGLQGPGASIRPEQNENKAAAGGARVCSPAHQNMEKKVAPISCTKLHLAKHQERVKQWGVVGAWVLLDGKPHSLEEGASELASCPFSAGARARWM